MMLAPPPELFGNTGSSPADLSAGKRMNFQVKFFCSNIGLDSLPMLFFAEKGNEDFPNFLIGDPSKISGNRRPLIMRVAPDGPPGG
jgi:hypothetical protein